MLNSSNVILIKNSVIQRRVKMFFSIECSIWTSIFGYILYLLIIVEDINPLSI